MASELVEVYHDEGVEDRKLKNLGVKGLVHWLQNPIAEDLGLALLINSL